MEHLTDEMSAVPTASNWSLTRVVDRNGEAGWSEAICCCLWLLREDFYAGVSFILFFPRDQRKGSWHISRYTVFDPVRTHQRWCPVLDVNPDDGVPLWKLIYHQVSPVREQVRVLTFNPHLLEQTIGDLLSFRGLRRQPQEMWNVLNELLIVLYQLFLGRFLLIHRYMGSAMISMAGSWCIGDMI